jgi:hypothetical protein
MAARATRLARLALSALTLACLLVVHGQTQGLAPRFWLAGRYDGNRIIVLFDAVEFKNSVPATARPLPDPAALGFLSPRELWPDFVAKLPRKSGAERFRIGDQFDLLMGDGRSTTVTLSTLIGYVSNDEDDDPSYIGAIAKVNEAAALVGARNYYALRRHVVSAPQPPPDHHAPRTFAPPPESSAKTFASLFDDPARFDVETQIAALLTSRMNELASPAQKKAVENLAPTLAVQIFRLADGSLRFFARAEWRADETPEATPTFAMAAWIAPSPILRILALEQPTSPYGFLYELPNLLNVVDLGEGRTGIIVDVSGPGDSTLGLFEYRDGSDMAHMHLLQSLTMDE